MAGVLHTQASGPGLSLAPTPEVNAPPGRAREGPQGTQREQGGIAANDGVTRVRAGPAEEWGSRTREHSSPWDSHPPVCEESGGLADLHGGQKSALNYASEVELPRGVGSHFPYRPEQVQTRVALKTTAAASELKLSNRASLWL